ncbi:DUF1109 domain-containing protein [Variovorax sp. J22P240]|uniref:DUF1109 domain-containing protein n=1 Tax=Variovorax sp. J22P240 TaxID=3053514 RepID=UPI00257560AF|nr:DUF1109 domain-containing protein [Variovorax sp. J22P240]MDL9998119.1 DUF1109 domain-containing protein [Variovorax sp. J22P240]
MKTDDLVAMLATGAAPVPRRAASRRLSVALLVGVPLSFAWMLYEYGMRRDLIQALFWPMFWVRLALPICVAITGFVIVQRLARPGARVRRAWLGLAVPLVVIWLLALVILMSSPAEERPTLIMGQTWRTCATNIATISLPVFVAALIALKGLAPTRPALAGAAAGAMAGGAGAAVYALHCIELAAPFIAIWYVVGILLPAVLGALMGSRILRW